MKKKMIKAAASMAMPMLKESAKVGMSFANRHLRRRSRRHEMGMMAMKGVGAAALALPLGWWLGRKMMADDQGDQA